MLPIRCLGRDLLQAPPHDRPSPTTWCYACRAKRTHMHTQKSSDHTFSVHTKGARTKSRVSPYPDYEFMKFRVNGPNTPGDSYVTIRLQCSMLHAFQGSYLTNPCMLHKHPATYSNIALPLKSLREAQNLQDQAQGPPHCGQRTETHGARSCT
jgi:hypothetical protein